MAASSATSASRARILGQAPIALAFEAAEPVGLGRHRLAVGEHGRLVVAEAPFEGVDQRQPLLEPPDVGRVVVEGLDEQADLGRDILELAVEAGESLGERLEPRVEPDELADVVEGRAEPLAGAAPLPQERVADRPAAAGDRLAMTGRGQPGLDLIGLAAAQPGRGDLACLVLGELDPADELTRVDAKLGQRCPVLAPAIDRRGNGLPDDPATAVGVEQVTLDALIEEPLLIVLAMDLDEPADGLGQACRGDRFVVEAGGRAPLGRDLADDDQRLRAAVEQGLDPGRRGAVPDEPGVGAGAEGQAERVDQQALPGAGLPGDDVESLAKLEPEPVDEGQVGDGELEQPSRRARRVTTAGAPPCAGAGPRTGSPRRARRTGSSGPRPTPRRHRQRRPAGPRGRRC